MACLYCIINPPALRWRSLRLCSSRKYDPSMVLSKTSGWHSSFPDFMFVFSLPLLSFSPLSPPLQETMTEPTHHVVDVSKLKDTDEIKQAYVGLKDTNRCCSTVGSAVPTTSYYIRIYTIVMLKLARRATLLWLCFSYHSGLYCYSHTLFSIEGYMAIATLYLEQRYIQHAIFSVKCCNAIALLYFKFWAILLQNAIFSIEGYIAIALLEFITEGYIAIAMLYLAQRAILLQLCYMHHCGGVTAIALLGLAQRAVLIYLCYPQLRGPSQTLQKQPAVTCLICSGGAVSAVMT